ncbi:hypothetical protein F5Y17DRAFT_357001 [Xylariaceae sp. FL0594]|nr:hypothetical protein F5Y17DRAFT_357001 [Xylariaceae sp. FL0594]
MIVLTCIAIYLQVTASSLFLPISTGTTVVTILLPLLAAANVYFTPVLNRLFASSRGYQQFIPSLLHILQGGLALVIATLAFQGFLPGRLLDCGLEGNWQHLWHAHDTRTIERIQNAFDCCGLRSGVDRSWPRDQCREIYGRTTSCLQPWRASMQRTSGLEFAIAVIVGLVQLAHLVYLRRRNQIVEGGSSDYRRIPHHGEITGRLIEEGREGYHDVEEDDNESDSVNPRSSPSASVNNNNTGDGAPHRVEPSGLGGEEAIQWRS